MSRPHATEIREQMEAMLSHCRRRLRAAHLLKRLREVLPVYLAGLVSLAALFFIIRVVAYLERVSLGLSGVHVLVLALVFGAMTCAWVVVQALREFADRTAGAAERLDLSQSTHNRIATALSLLRAGDHSAFADTAIRDGFEHLEKLQTAPPYVDSAVSSWRRETLYLALVVFLVAAGQGLRVKQQPTADAGPPAGDFLQREPAESAIETARLEDIPEREPDFRYRKKPEPVRGGPVGQEDAGESESGKRAEAGKESRSEGPAGQHASGKSRTSLASSTSRSAASGAGVKSKPGVTEPGKRNRPRLAGKKATTPSPLKKKNEKGGSINAGGSSGSGSMRTVQNEWSSEVKARSGDSDDFEQQEEPDEEMDRDKQRLGMQPALKNRSSQVSRELSLAKGLGTNNDMMRGRGGPNAQKKARGTATMIMGVPVPGFVKGRLLPGPTKSTQEEVEPTPREGDNASTKFLPSSRPEEMPQEHYHPPAVLGLPARNYLITFHAESENRHNGETPDE